MTKEILITIEGRQLEAEEEPVIVKVPGTYNFVKGSHFIRYREKQQEDDAIADNTIKISPTQVLITKKGAVQSQMIFDTEKVTLATYRIPYGELNFDIKTKSISLKENADMLELKMEYSLSAEGTHLSDNVITVVALPQLQNHFHQ